MLFSLLMCSSCSMLPFLLYADNSSYPPEGGEGTSVRARNAPLLRIDAGGKDLVSDEHFPWFLGHT